MGCDCSTDNSRKEEQDWWASDNHGVLIGISGPPCSGRSSLSTLLSSNLTNSFTLRQEDYARGTRLDSKAAYVRCDPGKVDHARLRKDVLVAANHYDFIIVEGRWCFQDKPLVALMHHKVHLDITLSECFQRLVEKDDRHGGDESIPADMFDRWFKPYFEDKAGYIHAKVDPLREQAAGEDLMDQCIFFDAGGAGSNVEPCAEQVLALVLERQSPSVKRGQNAADGMSSPRSSPEGASSASASASASSAAPAKWESHGHGKAAGSSSASAPVAAGAD